MDDANSEQCGGLVGKIEENFCGILSTNLYGVHIEGIFGRIQSK